jgi:hydroxymethylbilane synthase
MNLSHRSTAKLSSPILLHADGQGSLGIEIRSNDAKTLELLKPLNHRESKLACLAERALMRSLEGGCSVPIGVRNYPSYWWIYSATESGRGLDGWGTSDICGGDVVFGEKGSESEEEEAEKLGVKVAGMLLDNGARKLLDEIHEKKVHAEEKVTEVNGVNGEVGTAEKRLKGSVDGESRVPEETVVEDNDAKENVGVAEV